MRKEVVWAIIAGIVFGLVIAFGVVRINSTIKPKGETADSSPSPQPVSEFKITLSKPENEDVVTESSVTVSGITKGLSMVITSGEDRDYLVQADEKGSFEETVELTAGVNQIKITAFDPEGNASVEKVLVVYSSSFERTETTTEDKIEAKLQEVLNKPKAYLGVVTDIADSTIQVKTSTGEIKQVSVNKDEVVVVKTDPTSKVVKFTDIGIGDFIVAMGYRNGNQVLNTQRILITPALTEPTISVTQGSGADVTPVKTTQTLLFKEGEVAKAKPADIEDETRVIYVTEEVNGKSSPRTIFIVQ